VLKRWRQLRQPSPQAQALTQLARTANLMSRSVFVSDPSPGSKMPTYNPKAIEPRWQKFWLDNKTFRTPDISDKPKFYILDMFPYPSGAGLHVGHPEGYPATAILCRALGW